MEHTELRENEWTRRILPHQPGPSPRKQPAGFTWSRAGKDRWSLFVHGFPNSVNPGANKLSAGSADAGYGRGGFAGRPKRGYYGRRRSDPRTSTTIGSPELGGRPWGGPSSRRLGEGGRKEKPRRTRRRP